MPSFNIHLRVQDNSSLRWTKAKRKSRFKFSSTITSFTPSNTIWSKIRSFDQSCSFLYPTILKTRNETAFKLEEVVSAFANRYQQVSNTRLADNWYQHFHAQSRNHYNEEISLQKSTYGDINKHLRGMMDFISPY